MKKILFISMIALFGFVAVANASGWNNRSGMYLSDDGWMVELQDIQRLPGWDFNVRAVIIRDADNRIVISGWARAGMGDLQRTWISVFDSNKRVVSNNNLFFNRNGTITYRNRTFRFTSGW